MKGNDVTLIPNELASAVPGGAVTGANMIRDHKQGLTQEAINDIVLGKAINASFSASSNSADVNGIGNGAPTVIVSLSATVDPAVDSIEIYRNGTEEPIGQSSEAGVTGLTASDSVIVQKEAIGYRAEFKIGDYVKPVAQSVYGVYFGYGDSDFSNLVMKGQMRTGVGGNYTINVQAASKKLYIVVPHDKDINHAYYGLLDLLFVDPNGTPINDAESIYNGFKYYESYATYSNLNMTIKIE